MSVEDRVRFLAEDLITHPPVEPTDVGVLRSRARRRRRTYATLVWGPLAVVGLGIGALLVYSAEREPVAVERKAAADPGAGPVTSTAPPSTEKRIADGRVATLLPDGFTPVGPELDVPAQGGTSRSQTYRGPNPEQRLTVATLRGEGAEATFGAVAKERDARIVQRGGKTVVLKSDWTTQGGVTGMWLAEPGVLVQVFSKPGDEVLVLTVLDTTRLAS